MKYARLFENTVGEVFVPLSGVDISECFTAEVCQMFSVIPDNVEVGWIKLPDGSFVAPPDPAPETGPIPVTDLGAQ
jgi:hypothetical protein